MKENIMNVNKMISVLLENQYLLDDEDHNLVMHDLYTTSIENLEKGEKNLENLVDAYKLNLKVNHGYKNDKEALNQIKERLYEASQSADENMGGSRVEEYFLNAIKKLEMDADIKEEGRVLPNGLRYDKITDQTGNDFCTILSNFESNQNSSGPMTLLHALAGYYRNEGLKNFDHADSLLEAYDNLDSYSKEVDGTVDSKEVGPVQKYFKYHSTLVN